jgi:hypothetical protein
VTGQRRREQRDDRHRQQAERAGRGRRGVRHQRDHHGQQHDEHQREALRQLTDVAAQLVAGHDPADRLAEDVGDREDQRGARRRRPAGGQPGRGPQVSGRGGAQPALLRGQQDRGGEQRAYGEGRADVHGEPGDRQSPAGEGARVAEPGDDLFGHRAAGQQCDQQRGDGGGHRRDRGEGRGPHGRGRPGGGPGGAAAGLGGPAGHRRAFRSRRSSPVCADAGAADSTGAAATIAAGRPNRRTREKVALII